MIHLLVSNKHIQCVKWGLENGKPFLSSVFHANYKSKKLSDSLNDKELVNEINTVLHLQKKKFSFEGEQVYVTIPDSFCSTSVVYLDEEMSEADGWELSKWSIGQRFIKEENISDEFFGRSFPDKNKNTFCLKVSPILTETIKITIQEMGGSPLWMGTESSVFYGLNPGRGVTLFINDKSGYKYYHYSKNIFAKGFAKFSKNAWKLSSSDGSINEGDIFKAQIIVLGKLSYRRKSHFEGKRIRQVEPFKNIKKNDIKIPKEFTVHSQSISTGIISGKVLGHSLNFFNSPGLQKLEELKVDVEPVKAIPAKGKKRKKVLKKKKSNFQQFFAYAFFFTALTAVIFRDQLPSIYDKIDSEVRAFLNSNSQAVTPEEEIQTFPSTQINDFNSISFLRSQSLAFSLFSVVSNIDNDQILRLDASKGKIDITLVGPKNSLFPMDTIGNILNYSLRQVEGKDLYEFGYLVQYDAFLNQTLEVDDYVSFNELLGYFEKFIDLDVKTFDPYSHNALEHIPIIISSANMNSFKDVLSYILSNGSNLVLNKVIMDLSSINKSNTIRLFITYLNYNND